MINEYAYAPIDIEIYTELTRRYPNGQNSVIQHVLWDFLERTVEDFDAQAMKNGIRWENISLPEGSKIRTKYFDNYLEATVVDKALAWNGKMYSSIAKLINEMRGGTSNNAWKVTEIKRPSDADWISAQQLRI